jgi:hypothetical protein
LEILSTIKSNGQFFGLDGSLDRLLATASYPASLIRTPRGKGEWQAGTVSQLLAWLSA